MPIKLTKGKCENCGHADHSACQHLDSTTGKYCACTSPHSTGHEFVESTPLKPLEVVQCDVCEAVLGIVRSHDVNGSKIICTPCHVNIMQMQLEFGAPQQEMELEDAVRR